MESRPDSPSHAHESFTLPPRSPPIARRILSTECGLAALVLGLGILGLVQTTMRTGLYDRAAWILGGIHGAIIAVALIEMTRIILQPHRTLAPDVKDLSAPNV